jgi:N-formylglutamate amidohydrolase
MTARPSDPFAFHGDFDARVVAAAIHAGHDLRPEVADLLALDEATRLREEDPYTDRIAACCGSSVVAHRSRFEVDLNRERHEAVYRTAEESWGLQVWRDEPPARLVERSLRIYDRFYEELGDRLDRLAATGPFVILDVHTYNHRRGGPTAACAPQEGNPDVNLGTGSMPETWRGVADAFMAALSQSVVQGRGIDVRENVRFVGRGFPLWIHRRYRGRGCALALEFKKTFMDEWTGQVDDDHLAELTEAVRQAVPSVQHALEVAA